MHSHSVRHSLTNKGGLRCLQLASELVRVAGFEPAASSSRSQVRASPACGVGRLTLAQPSAGVHRHTLAASGIVTQLVTRLIQAGIAGVVAMVYVGIVVEYAYPPSPASSGAIQGATSVADQSRTDRGFQGCHRCCQDGARVPTALAARVEAVQIGSTRTNVLSRSRVDLLHSGELQLGQLFRDRLLRRSLWTVPLPVSAQLGR